MNKRILLWGGLIVVMGIIVFAIFRIAGEEEIISETGEAAVTGETSEILDVRQKDWTKGNPDADVVIIKYSDFQCPACRFFAQADDLLSEEYAEDVLFVYRHFPLGFEYSRLAAQYAEAAGRQGQFWGMHDLIYINQLSWVSRNAEPVFRQYAEVLELDSEQLNDDLQDPAIMKRIESDYSDGQQLGVRGVPTIYINGEEARLPGSLNEYRNLIESHL